MRNARQKNGAPGAEAPARYEVAPRELDAIMSLLYRLLDVRITFFDMQARELGTLHIKGMSAYCAQRRRNRGFDQRCVACDRGHLEEAKRTRDVLIYHCHNGLIEGSVPLYDKHGIYLGAIVFGQLRDPARPVPEDASPAQRRLFRGLQTCTPERARDIGYLLKYVSEYIIEKELIRYRNRPWAEKIERHVAEHPDRRITLRELAGLIGHSPSFLTHHFRSEFGRSPQEYVLRVKMEKARRMLESGSSVKDAAYALGFYDPFHFSKRFKAYWGTPPSRISP
jgi:AraC-like DNA-binding protein